VLSTGNTAMSLEDLNEHLKLLDKLNAQVNNLSAKLAEKRGQMEAVNLSGKDSKEISGEVHENESELKELSAAAEQARKLVEELTQKQAETDKIARMDDLRNIEQDAYKTMITNLFELGNAYERALEIAQARLEQLPLSNQDGK
jgi:predicted RNase H-like nuclease (RuvC/YqgF family)